MADILAPLGLELPIGGELHSRAMHLRNLTRINNAATIIDYASSAFNDGTWNMTICKFTRVRVGTVGIVIADVLISLPAAALPANTATPTELVGVIPVGFAGLAGASVPLQMANTGNSGTGSLVQVGFKMSNRAFMIRSAGTAFTTVAGSTITWSTTYRWDGNL